MPESRPALFGTIKGRSTVQDGDPQNACGKILDFFQTKRSLPPSYEVDPRWTQSTVTGNQDVFAWPKGGRKRGNIRRIGRKQKHLPPVCDASVVASLLCAASPLPSRSPSPSPSPDRQRGRGLVGALLGSARLCRAASPLPRPSFPQGR